MNQNPQYNPMNTPGNPNINNSLMNIKGICDLLYALGYTSKSFPSIHPDIVRFAYLLIFHNSLSNNSYYQFSGTTEIAVLAEVDTLPSAEIQASVSNGNCNANATQC